MSVEFERRRRLWPRLLKLEPRLQELFQRAKAGDLGLDDLVLTYWSYVLEPLVGVNRQHDLGDPILFTDDAFEAALTALHEATDGLAQPT